MRASSILVLVAAVSGPAFARPPDDTLAYYLSKSEYAVEGEVVSAPARVKVVPVDGVNFKESQVVYACRVKVTEHFNGSTSLPVKGEVTVYVVRWADEGDDRPASLKKGQKCVLFLNWVHCKIGGADARFEYVTSDPWFGVQPYNAKMAALLREAGRKRNN